MARTNYTGVPETMPDLDAPDDLQRINATPQAFGAGIGQGLSDLGEGLQKSADFYGQVASDHAYNDLLEQGTAILYGDPSKTVTGPDGQPAPDGGFMGKRGADAMSAAKDTGQALDNLIQQQRASLQTPESQHQFDVASRRLRTQWAMDIGRHADEQQKAWATDVAQQSIAVHQNAVGTHLGNEVALEGDQDALRDAFVKQQQVLYGTNLPPEVHDAAVLRADQAFYGAKARAEMFTDSLAAKKTLEDHWDVMSTAPEAYSLRRETQERAADAIVGQYSDPAFMGQHIAALPQPVIPGAPAPGSQPLNLGNVKTKDGTFAQPATAMDGALLAANNLRDGYRGLTLAQIGEKWAPKADGNDPAKWAANVSAASGVGVNTVPNLNDPKILQSLVKGIGVAEKSKADLGAFPDSTVAQAVQASLRGQHAQLSSAPASAAGPEVGRPGQGLLDTDGYLASVRERAAQEGFDLNTQENIVKRVELNIRRDDAGQSSALEGTARDTIAYLQSGGDPAKVGITPSMLVGTVRGERGQQLAQDLTDAMALNKAERQLITAPQSQVAAILAGQAPQGPAGFQDAERDYRILREAAVRRQEAIFGSQTKRGDPAGYILGTMPDVNAAWGAALKSPQAFDVYVKKLDGAYGALEIPEQYRQVIPRQAATGVVANLMTKTPADALKELQGVQAETGLHWDRAYRDLVQAGLPAGMQTPLVVAGSNPANAKVMIAAQQRDADAKANGKPVMEQEAAGLNFNGHSVTSLIDKAIDADQGLTSLRATFGVAGRGGVEQFSGVQRSIKDTALYLVLNGSVKDPTQAAQQASKMVTGLYDFVQQPGHPPARVPRGSAADFQAATTGTLQGLKPGDVMPYAAEQDEHGRPLNIPQAERAQHALDGAKHAFWVTVPGANGKPVVRAIDPTSGNPVMTRNGPLDLPIANLPIIAQRVRNAPPPPHANPAGVLISGMPLG